MICVVALVLLIPIPETPTWLASKGRTAKAEKSLRIFKGLPRKGLIEHQLKRNLSTAEFSN